MLGLTGTCGRVASGAEVDSRFYSANLRNRHWIKLLHRFKRLQIGRHRRGIRRVVRQFGNLQIIGKLPAVSSPIRAHRFGGGKSGIGIQPR